MKNEKKENNSLRGVGALIADNRYYFAAYALALVVGVYFLLSIEKGDAVLWINSGHTEALDRAFLGLSWLGNGIFWGLLLIPILFVKVKYSLHLLSSYAFSGIFAQILKKIFDLPRPKKFFPREVFESLHTFDPHSYLSFPSGHSTTAFAMTLILAIITRNKPIGIFYLIVAVLIAVSRVYLAEHFLVDIFFGSILGVLISVVSYNLLERTRAFQNSRVLNSSIIKVFGKR